MAHASSGDTAPVLPGHFHRLGLAARPADNYATWLSEVLGAVRIDSDMRQVHGIPFGGSGNKDGISEESGAFSEMIWLGTTPICIFAAVDDVGQLGAFVAKYGSGLHSVAWTVQDIWKTETLLRRNEIRITGVDLPGRHFFIHPADTAGLLIEITDTEFTSDPRDNPDIVLPVQEDSVVKGAQLGWLTMSVKDPAKSAQVLSSVIEASEVNGLPRNTGEELIDLRVNDVIIRLLKRDDADTSRDTLHSWCISVPDLTSTCSALMQAGIRVESQSELLATTHQEDTLGMRLQWVQASALIS